MRSQLHGLAAGAVVITLLLPLSVLGHGSATPVAAVQPSPSPTPTPAPGPVLKPGFPVPLRTSPGSYSIGATGVVVGDIDGDPELEVLASGLASGRITAVEPDGSPIPGWPGAATTQHEYLGLVEANRARPGFEVSAIEAGDRMVVLDGRAHVLPGWPRHTGNYGSSPASAGDLNADGVDELAYQDEDWHYNVREAAGDIPPGTQWPRWVDDSSQRQAEPAVADLNGDGRSEVIGGGDETDLLNDKNLVAYHADGSDLAGWPKHLDGFTSLQRVAVGQVDGDPAPEIVVAAASGMYVFAPDGKLERSWSKGASKEGGPVLADLDEDGDQEIILGWSTGVWAFQGDGTPVPGFPVLSTGYHSEAGGPVVGDVDNDGHQDIVVTSSEVDGEASSTVVTAVNRAGQTLAGFPMTVPVQSDFVPAVADIDRNGRTDLLIAGSSLPGSLGGIYDYEYPSGVAAPPAWSQYGGGPRHQFRAGQRLTPSHGAAPGATSQSRIRLVRDTVPGVQGSAPRDLTTLGSQLVYTADTPSAGREPWVSDGTAAGTTPLADILPGSASSRPEQLTRAGTSVFFVANDGTSGLELWRTTGTAAGTSLVADLNPGVAGSQPRELTALGPHVFFSADNGTGRELYVSDGTPAGTHIVVDPTPEAGDATDPAGLARAGNRLIFDGADTITDPANPQLSEFSTDGTAAGTVRLPASASRFYRQAHSGSPYATIASGSALIWTDGTPQGTSARGGFDMIGEVSARAGLALVSAADPSDNLEGYWARPGSFGRLTHRDSRGRWIEVGAPGSFQMLKKGWIFAAQDEAGSELWWSEGTPTTTHRVVDLVRGARSSWPRPLLSAKGMALVQATTPSLGDELWRTDGTRAGTSLVTDLAAGRLGSRVTEAVVVGSRIVLAADDGRTGPELWSMPLNLLGPLPNTRITSRPAPVGRFRVAIVGFTSSIPHSGFRCRFDNGITRSCTSPWKRTVAPGGHRLTIMAIAHNGLRESVPALVRWRVTSR